MSHPVTDLSAFKYSVVPTRHFLGKPVINEEMNIEIEAGKLLIIKLLAVGKINENTGTRECFFEVNAETRVVVIEDRQAAVSKVSREKASSEPGSIGSPMVSYMTRIFIIKNFQAYSNTLYRLVSLSRFVSRKDRRSRLVTLSVFCLL
jgi:pyruvate carboxylase